MQKCHNVKVYLRSAMDPCVLIRQLGRWQETASKVIEMLSNELANSMTHAHYAFEHRKPTPTLTMSPMDWEQCIVEGHPTHPMHKSRFALPPLDPIPPDANLHSPDVRFVCLPRDSVVLGGDYAAQIKRFIPAETLAAVDMDSQVVMPVHPRQLPNVHALFPQATLLPGVLPTRAQASLRTVVPIDHPEWAIKLCLGIRVTSAMRTITSWTTFMSTHMRELLDKLVSNTPETLSSLNVVGSAVVVHPDVEVSKHLSCLIREGEAQKISENEMAIACLSLVERDAQGVPFVQSAFGLDTCEKRLAFFERYAKIYLEAFMTPVHKYGFTFEAHSQNTLARFDKTTKQLTGFLVRDFGGVRCHQETLQRTLGESLNVLPGSCCVVDSLDKVYSSAHHTIIQGHMQGLIRALDLHRCGTGWRVVRSELRRVLPVDSSLYRYLSRPRVALKCFVKMRIAGMHRSVSSCFDASCIMAKPCSSTLCTQQIYDTVPNILLYQGAHHVAWDDVTVGRTLSREATASNSCIQAPL
ncbi:IucC family-domain-containing protein [Thamnocephalis sphaerospora]|uniref:IucC family-domain-containing protein n=1 Tax=Thamnocephalis sphaerospora TaxID=78915 RepID=A0A4V1IX15_9FUNG|nr:IucC family-domain-containing protein [Thamnocephalis sphaerospora]|eukprot:RKP09479.1 IucC family-domain-containing protein [Thamnocephalis sphaerospora]